MVTVALLLIETELARALMLAPVIHSWWHQYILHSLDPPFQIIKAVVWFYGAEIGDVPPGLTLDV